MLHVSIIGGYLSAGKMFSARLIWPILKESVTSWSSKITGLITIAGWLLIFPPEISLSSLQFGALIIIVSLLIAVSWNFGRTIANGQIGRSDGVHIIGFRKSDCYDGEYIFLIEGNVAQGSILELRRTHDNVEVAIALVEIMEINTQGQYQARIIWFSPGHLNDLMTSKYNYSDIFIGPSIQLRTLQKTKIDFGKNKF